ncbi:DUF2087 domain-containing protein [Streptomyces sp. TRM68416]|uniref:DUF2087 domain-containing protein n=1 Tax=Streptomyces sp. TRM68416 TaxID=2758412 RepID=UPI0016620EC3|nr:DUF2087 domain-containing protein [Streptomyces sp. TRM68416]MBD0844035.1 DUF2087 domain-containing protein [Streptomyces sp. TRM68416]
MATDELIRLFTDEKRARVFAAVALGAATPAEAAETAGLTVREAATALRRLREQGVVTDGDGGALGVAYDAFRERVRARAAQEAAPDAGGDPTLRTFVRDGRLVRLPRQWTRKKLVLRHIAEQSFEPGVEYPERAVDDRLRAWCEEDGEVDHVTLRRYLVDLHHLHRSAGVYRTALAA